MFICPEAPPSPTSLNPEISDIFTSCHDPSRALDQLVAKSGGTWPPSPTFDSSWPAPLRAYHAAYEIVAPLFPVLQSSLSDAENRQTIDVMRARIRGLLSGDSTIDEGRCAVDRKSVAQMLTEAKYWVGYHDRRMASAMMGFCACVCFLRHVYRWGVSPVVREAQIETYISFPPELDEPWQLLQRYFGFTSPGGGLSTCQYFNTGGVETNFKPVYCAVRGLPELHQNTTYWHFRLFLEIEYRASLFRPSRECKTHILPVASHVPSLKEANVIFQNTSRFFFDTLRDRNISLDVWLPYVQGYLGWALPGADGVVISGASGRQSLMIQTLDAFLGIRLLLPLSEVALHVPVAQRDWLQSLREVSLLIQDHRDESSDELQKMVHKLRIWRMGHMTRVVPYQRVHRPERVFMTTGESILPEDQVTDEPGAVHHLKRLLQERVRQTI
ncbi:hypothetical protein B0H13DRAFT_1633803 [Mycena leptocephala]|nr:hypothetical protein B0H13DRAFT_1633803 [Mycena leptocephala]